MRYRWAIAVLMIGLFQVAFGVTSEASAADGWVTETEKPKVVNGVALEGNIGSYCSGRWQMISIYGHGQTKACLYGAGPELATYYDSNGSMATALRKGLSPNFYPIEGICRPLGCQYSSETDRLVTQEYDSGFMRWLIAYEDFVQRLEFQPLPTPRFIFTSRPPDYRLTTTTGGAVSTASFTLSSDGKHTAVEVKNQGILMVNLDDRTSKRIMAPGYRYGYGYDPTIEMAISHDAKTLVVAGQNASFKLVSLTDECGEPISAVIGNYFPEGVIGCRSVESNIFALIRDFDQAYNPRFDSTDQYVTVDVTRYNNVPHVMTLAHPRLDTSTSVKYLSMGDSFTSGEGELSDDYYKLGTNNGNENCHTSLRSYPFLVAESRQWTHAGVACSGATLADITGRGHYWGQFDRLKDNEAAAQLKDDALAAFQPGRIRQADFIAHTQPDLVSIGIGGNDSGILDKVKSCAGPGECRWTHGSLRRSLANEIDALSPRYIETFKILKGEARTGKVFAISYPLAVSLTGGCDPLTQILFSKTERSLLYHSIKRLNRVMHQAAIEADIEFIDIETAFAGTELCGSINTSSMNGLRFGNEISVGGLRVVGSESYHPTPAGHARIQALVESAFMNDASSCHTVCEVTDETFWTIPGPQENRQYHAVSVTDDQCTVICKISISPGVLKPGSVVKAVLYSDPLQLGSFKAESDGSLEAEVRLPTTVSGGFHTLTLETELFDSGQAVLYQAIAIPAGSPVLATGQQPDSRSLSATGEYRSMIPKDGSIREEKMATSVLGHTTSDDSTTHQKDSAVIQDDVTKTTFDWRLLLWVLTGIMMLWLLYALLLRKLFQKVSSKKSNRPDI